MTLTKKGTVLMQELSWGVEAYDSRLYPGVSREEMGAVFALTSKVLTNQQPWPVPRWPDRSCR